MYVPIPLLTPVITKEICVHRPISIHHSNSRKNVIAQEILETSIVNHSKPQYKPTSDDSHIYPYPSTLTTICFYHLKNFEIMRNRSLGKAIGIIIELGEAAYVALYL